MNEHSICASDMLRSNNRFHGSMVVAMVCAHGKSNIYLVWAYLLRTTHAQHDKWTSARRKAASVLTIGMKRLKFHCRMPSRSDGWAKQHKESFDARNKARNSAILLAQMRENSISLPLPLLVGKQTSVDLKIPHLDLNTEWLEHVLISLRRSGSRCETSEGSWEGLAWGNQMWPQVRRRSRQEWGNDKLPAMQLC